MKDPVSAAADRIRQVAPTLSTTAIVLGSGFGAYADGADGISFDYSALPGFPVPTSGAHKGRLVIGRRSGRAVIILDGRVHLYEGFSAAESAVPIRVLSALGVQRVILTNAAGALAPGLSTGEIVVIEDHLSLASLTGRDPLVGRWNPEDGERFVSLNGAYSRALSAHALEAARAAGLTARSGVYAFVAGPAIETPAEVRALRMLGGDVVGMSTVPEVIVARQCGLDVCAISAVTNVAVDSVHSPHVTTAAEVYSAADAMRPAFCEMLDRLLVAVT